MYSPESFVKHKDLPNFSSIFGNLGNSWDNALPNDLYLKNVPKCILKAFNKVGNVGTGLDTLRSYSLPAGSLKTNGDYFDAVLQLNFAGNDDNKRIQLSFAGTVFLNTGLIDIDLFGGLIALRVQRVTATSINIFSHTSLGDLSITSAAVVTSTGMLNRVGSNDAFVIPSLDSNASILLLEAESATATNDNITHSAALIELVRS